jgi:hypothetical protein
MERRELARVLRRPEPDDGRPALRFHRDEDDDDPPFNIPPLAPAGIITVLAAHSLDEFRTSGSSRSLPTDAAESQSDGSPNFSTLAKRLKTTERAQDSQLELFSPGLCSVNQSGDVSDTFSTNPTISPRSSRCAVRESPSSPVPLTFARKLGLLSSRVLRRILAAKESIFKYGTFVPKNDREAESSPEASRWKAGRDLEWLRLEQHGTFDGNWT